MRQYLLVLAALLASLTACSAEPPGSASPDTADTLDGSADVAAPDAAPATDAIPAGVDDTGACVCPKNWHCTAANLCQPDVCTKGEATCASLTSTKKCAADGASFTVVPCSGDSVCFGGVCWDPICEPGEVAGCDGPKQLRCNSLGIEWIGVPCPAGQACQSGSCREVAANVLILMDTSGSMNWRTDISSAPAPCAGASCDPPWSFPNCDSGALPRTGIGKAKKALAELFASPVTQNLRLAMQRFPQVEFGADIFGPIQPTCDTGGLSAAPLTSATMSGDNGTRATTEGSWFTQQLREILAVPFTVDEQSNLSDLARWVDFVEESGAPGAACSISPQCPVGSVCMSGGCRPVTNPELRAVGPTPLGKSLFYAGEIFRHRVLVEGRPCTTTASCGSPHHVCIAGACRDSLADCRENIIILFTDGAETENVHITDFFHPRVQAKRLHYGLGCSGDADCVGGARCKDGICRPPAGAVNETAMVCETADLSCSNVADCPDPCATWTGCQGFCTKSGVDLVDGTGSDVLRDGRGVPISLTIHVVDASGVPGANRLIGEYGGGSQFSIDLSDSGAILEVLTTIIGDTKAEVGCAGD
jgi:hypothetical protein